VASETHPQFEVTLTLPLELAFEHPAGGRSHFHFVRHGRTDGNVRRILVGRTDIPLDDVGRHQARAVAKHLAALDRADVIVASPLLRARETAQAIADLLAIPMEIDPGLAELNFGSFEGWSFDEIRQQRPDFAAQIADFEFDVHWPDGERLSEFHLRTRSALINLATRYASYSAIVVTHGGFLGSLASQLLGSPPNDWARYQIRNCSVTHLEITGEGSRFHRFNDDAHLVLSQPDPIP
jgi:broad specificity phosphatase PhoE